MGTKEMATTETKVLKAQAIRTITRTVSLVAFETSSKKNTFCKTRSDTLTKKERKRKKKITTNAGLVLFKTRHLHKAYNLL